MTDPSSPITARLKGGAVGNVCKSLLSRSLIEEVPATDLNMVYCHYEERGPLTLRATSAACEALGIDDDDPPPSGHPGASANPVPRLRPMTKATAATAATRPPRDQKKVAAPNRPEKPSTPARPRHSRTRPRSAPVPSRQSWLTCFAARTAQLSTRLSRRPVGFRTPSAERSRAPSKSGSVWRWSPSKQRAGAGLPNRGQQMNDHAGLKLSFASDRRFIAYRT